MYDVIVVGARCGGSPTAMLLARRGYRVLLVDRAAFPSDTMSTHFIHPPGVASLARWGLLDQLMATGCPPVRRLSFDVGPFALVGSAPPVDGADFPVAPRRTVLDKLLVEAAVEAGVELRERFTVTGLVGDNGRVTGIRGRDKGSAEVTDTGRLVVGADGLHSIVSREVEAPVYEDRGVLTCGAYAYWHDARVEGAELYPRGDRFVIAFPTHNGLTVVFMAVIAAEAHQFRSQLERNYLGSLDLVPQLSERVRAGSRQGRIVSTADLPNFFRRPYGPGWALVGDAGYHEDPLIAHGISNAFRDAELLADAADAGLSGVRPLDEALAAYERSRNEAGMPIFELGCQLSRLGPPPPEMLQLFGALAGNQREIDRFIGALEGTVAVPDFFGPENVRRLIEAA